MSLVQGGAILILENCCWYNQRQPYWLCLYPICPIMITSHHKHQLPPPEAESTDLSLVYDQLLLLLLHPFHPCQELETVRWCSLSCSHTYSCSHLCSCTFPRLCSCSKLGSCIGAFSTAPSSIRFLKNIIIRKEDKRWYLIRKEIVNQNQTFWDLTKMSMRVYTLVYPMY